MSIVSLATLVFLLEGVAFQPFIMAGTVAGKSVTTCFYIAFRDVLLIIQTWPPVLIQTSRSGWFLLRRYR